MIDDDDDDDGDSCETMGPRLDISTWIILDAQPDLEQVHKFRIMLQRIP